MPNELDPDIVFAQHVGAFFLGGGVGVIIGAVIGLLIGG